MFFFGRGVSAFFNQFFRWLFWNKTGQKVLFTIVIAIIFVCFIKLGEVAAVEEVEDINYKAKSYYDGVVNDAILRIDKNWENFSDTWKSYFLDNQQYFYFYYGSADGSSLCNAQPTNNGTLRLIRFGRGNILNNATISTYDYLGVSGMTMYSKSFSGGYFSPDSSFSINASTTSVYFPAFLTTYTPEAWTTYITAKRNGDTETIIALLEDINESLSNTTPDQESEDSVVVDSSATDSVDTSEIDSVFSSAFTSFANKFTYYDLSDADQWVITINGTRIVLRSNILYNMIHDTWFYPMLQLLWYYIFGHYAFVWLTNLIHKIKDGSILDGLEVNEVISKEML